MYISNYIHLKSTELISAGFQNAKNEILWYLDHNNIISKKDFILMKSDPISENIKSAIDTFFYQRQQSIPFQYILNQCNFYGKNFIIDNRALIPRPETETVIRFLSNQKQSLDILEIGTGSGAISCVLSLNKIGKNILATDICSNALELAQENINYHNIKNIKLIQHDILNQSFNQKFDLIIANPPYISLEAYNKLDLEIKNYEPQHALTDYQDGLIFYRRFSNIVKDLLKPNGEFYCEIGLSKTCKYIESIFNKNII